jgi:hypothetical protein
VLSALTWRFEPTIVVVLFGVLRFVLAMVGVIARVVMKEAKEFGEINISIKQKTLKKWDATLLS